MNRRKVDLVCFWRFQIHSFLSEYDKWSRKCYWGLVVHYIEATGLDSYTAICIPFFNLRFWCPLLRFGQWFPIFFAYVNLFWIKFSVWILHNEHHLFSSVHGFTYISNLDSYLGLITRLKVFPLTGDIDLPIKCWYSGSFVTFNWGPVRKS